MAEAKNVDKVIQQLCDAINESKTSDSKSCDVKSLTESQKNQLLLLAGKLATTGDGDKESLKTLGNQLATMGFKVQDSGSFTLLIAALASMHKANDFNEVAAMSSPAQSPATSSFADTVLTAGLQAPSQDKSLSGDWRKLVNESWASRDPLLPEVEYLPESEVAVASSKPKTSTQPEALAEVPNVAAPVASTAIAPSNSDNRSNGFGFSSGEAPTIASTTSSQSSRDPSSEGPSTSEHSPSGANEVAARAGTGNPYNEVNKAAQSTQEAQPSRMNEYRSAPESPRRISGLVDTGAHEVISLAGSDGVQRPSSLVIPPEYDGTDVVAIKSSKSPDAVTRVLGGPGAPDAVKECLPEGFTAFPKSESDCDRVFKDTYMTKNESGQDVLNIKKFYRCMGTVVGRFAYEDEQRQSSRANNVSVEQTFAQMLKAMGPNPEPSERERRALIENLLVTERMYKWGSCGALGLREPELRTIVAREHKGCRELQENVFSVQSQFANSSRATEITKGTKNEPIDRRIFESLFVSYQMSTLGTFQDSYSSLFKDQVSTNKVFTGFRNMSKLQQGLGGGPLANVLQNVTDCFKPNQMGGYLVAVSADREKSFEETFGCSATVENSKKIKKALDHAAAYQSTDPPCGKVTQAWQRLVDSKTPEDRRINVTILKRIHDSQNFVHNIVEFAKDTKAHGDKALSEQIAKMSNAAKGVAQNKLSPDAALDQCKPGESCKPKEAQTAIALFVDFRDKVFSKHNTGKKESKADRTPSSEKVNQSVESDENADSPCDQVLVAKQMIALESEAVTVASKEGFNPKEKINNPGFSKKFARKVLSKASRMCDSSEQFKTSLKAAELRLRAQACKCSHVSSLTLLKNEFLDCERTAPSTSCGPVLTNYSLYLGLLEAYQLLPDNLKDTEYESELMTAPH